SSSISAGKAHFASFGRRQLQQGYRAQDRHRRGDGQSPYQGDTSQGQGAQQDASGYLGDAQQFARVRRSRRFGQDSPNRGIAGALKMPVANLRYGCEKNLCETGPGLAGAEGSWRV